MNIIKEFCKVCGSDNPVNNGKPVFHVNGSKYNVLECRKCSLQWSSPMPSEDELTMHYNTYYNRRFKRILKTSLKFLRDLLTLKEVREYYFLKKVLEYTNVKKFLDYGCGEGEMLLLGRKFGWECTGTEYSEELKDKFVTLGINVIVATDFENSKLKQSYFDLIILKHLIEHIKDIPSFLNQAKKYLSDNGVLAIKTPSNSSFRAKTRTANWHFVNPPEHLWSFNTLNFKLLLENNGFEVLSIKNSLLVDELICYAKVRN
ncbi:MAG: class I SAM-dependent methyltransferase [Ignavibacteriota bacterium]